MYMGLAMEILGSREWRMNHHIEEERNSEAKEIPNCRATCSSSLIIPDIGNSVLPKPHLVYTVNH